MNQQANTPRTDKHGMTAADWVNHWSDVCAYLAMDTYGVYPNPSAEAALERAQREFRLAVKRFEQEMAQ